MKRILFSVLAAVLIVVVTSGEVWAQATAQISGTVRDQSGAVLPGVEVVATQTDTGIARTAVTNETGSYVLTNLPIGPYRLEAGLPGFRTYAQTGIVLQVNASPVINPVLEVGQISEQVEVQANAALVETRSVGVGQVVENARILELPLNGRQIVDLIGLAGGSNPAPLVNGGSRDPFASASFSVAGGLNTGLGYTLDGAYHNNPHDNGYMSTPFPDALQEFKVETSATGAQNGMKSAGSVSLVTKSGTNEFHGDLFEFVRNGKFNARNAFATRRDTIKRNQFGGTLGGPITRNKLFIFGGYQGTTIRQDPSDTISFVPNAAMLAGDFTTFASPACNGGRQMNLRAPFVNNRIDPALYSKPALALSSKLPKTSDPCGKIVFGSPSLTNQHMAVAKIDYQKSSNHSIFGRYLLDSFVSPASFDLNHNPLSISTADDGMAQAFTFGDTYLFGANIVNAFRLTANRIAAGKFEPKGMATAGLGPSDIGVKAFTYAPHTANYNVTGGFAFSSFGGPTRSAIFAGSDDLGVIRGDHQMSFGAQTAMWWSNNYSGTYQLPFAFNGQKTGLGMADFLTGNVSTLTNGPGTARARRALRIGLYATDTWKMNPKLTVNYGLRWEPYFPIVDRHGGPIHFDRDAFVKGTRSGQFDTTPPGVFFPGDPGFPLPEGQYTQWRNFSPRVGLGWDVAGDGRTSIRASLGTFYDFPATYYQNLPTAPPYFPRFGLTDVDFENPWSNYPGGDPFPLPYGNKVGRNAPWPTYSLVNVYDYDTPNTQVAQWNLSLQKQVGADWLVSASYLGNHSTHLWTTQQYNPAIFLGLGPCTINGTSYTTCSTTANQEQRRRLILENPKSGQFFGFMPKIDTGATASYNGLILSAQRRAARGVTVTANYTWSHCISDPGGNTLVVGGSNNDSYTNPDNRHFDRGNCTTAATDRRHVFNLSAVASTPQFSNATLRALGSGWRLSPIFKALSGGFMSITTNQDRALNTTPNQRVNQLRENPYGDKSVSNYLSPSAFETPALGTFGNVGAGSVAGPGTWQFDLALSRSFQLRESQRVEFRAEAFNVTNSFLMNNPTTNLNSNTFGQVLSARDPRIMQFALKYVF
jgi:Carboxypeptidase regulatory-like domain